MAESLFNKVACLRPETLMKKRLWKEPNAFHEEFTKYFNKEGCVPWQWRCCKIDI